MRGLRRGTAAVLLLAVLVTVLSSATSAIGAGGRSGRPARIVTRPVADPEPDDFPTCDLNIGELLAMYGEWVDTNSNSVNDLVEVAPFTSFHRWFGDTARRADARRSVARTDLHARLFTLFERSIFPGGAFTLCLVDTIPIPAPVVDAFTVDGRPLTVVCGPMEHARSRFEAVYRPDLPDSTRSFLVRISFPGDSLFAEVAVVRSQ